MDVFSRFGPVQSVELSEKPGAPAASDSDVSIYFTSRRRQVTPHSHNTNTRLLQRASPSHHNTCVCVCVCSVSEWPTSCSNKRPE